MTKNFKIRWDYFHDKRIVWILTLPMGTEMAYFTYQEMYDDWFGVL